MNALVSILAAAALIGLMMRLRLWADRLGGRSSSGDVPLSRCAPSDCPRQTGDRCQALPRERTASATEPGVDPKI